MSKAVKNAKYRFNRLIERNARPRRILRAQERLYKRQMVEAKRQSEVEQVEQAMRELEAAVPR